MRISRFAYAAWCQALQFDLLLRDLSLLDLFAERLIASRGRLLERDDGFRPCLANHRQRWFGDDAAFGKFRYDAPE